LSVPAPNSVLFFDLDGTLIDSQVGITRCVAHALERLGHPGLPEDALLGWIGPALRVSFGAQFDDATVVEEAVLLYRERFDAQGWLEHEIYPGIQSAIEALHSAGRRMVVVTAKNEPHARRIVAHLPFGHCFEDVVGATEDGRLSHKPELIAEALQRLRLDPRDCTMIGDRHLDIEGARHHRMASIGVLWGFGSEAELRDAGADQLIATPSALAAWLPA